MTANKEYYTKPKLLAIVEGEIKTFYDAHGPKISVSNDDNNNKEPLNRILQAITEEKNKHNQVNLERKQTKLQLKEVQSITKNTHI